MTYIKYISIVAALFIGLHLSAKEEQADSLALIEPLLEQEGIAAIEQEPEQEDEGEQINAKEIIFSHIGDSYEWHFGTFGKKEVAIPLPVIVHSSTGWHCFSSHHLEHGHTHEGLYIAQEGSHEGKIVELIDGQEVRPFDVSMTKNVVGLIINSLVLLIIMFCTLRWYKRHDVLTEAPSGIAALIEPVIIFMEDEVIKDSIGEGWEKFSPYLLTAFFFILANNLMGIIPFFPGGANVTGNIAITLVLAMATFLFTNINKSKHYWLEIFWPDVPWWLKAPLPIMPVVEFIGMLTKPFALMVRLFANIMAGHAMVLSIVCIIFLTAKMGAAMNSSLSVVAILFGVFIDCLEVLVAFIQAYVFTMLSSVFIGMAHSHHHEH